MLFRSSLGRDLDHAAMLHACGDLAAATSSADLERRLDRWLAQWYAPRAWSVDWTPHGSDEPLVTLKGGAVADLPAPVVVPLPVGDDMHAHLALFIDEQRPTALDVLDALKHVLAVLANTLQRVCGELQSLAHTAELLFMRSLLHSPAHVDHDLDALAATLLAQLNVSSIHVLIDHGGPPGLSWGIAGQRVTLDMAPAHRRRLLQCVDALLGDGCATAHTHVLLRRKEIVTLGRAYELPYFAPFQSLLVVPICTDDVLGGAVIVGEERSWARQPIGQQVVSVCRLLAHAVSLALTRNQFVAKIIARERSLHALIDALAEAVVTTQNGVIVSWNRAAQHMFGYTAADVLGRVLADVLPNMPAPLHAAAPPPGAYDWIMHTTAERDLLVACSMTHVLAADDATPSVLYVFKDTSQQHELEYLKDELLSSVSHELRTPLNGIYGFGRLLLDRPHMPDAMRHEALESLHASIERLTRMTDDFIDVARARRHRLPLVLDAVDAAQTVRSAFRDIKRRHTQHMSTLR